MKLTQKLASRHFLVGLLIGIMIVVPIVVSVFRVNGVLAPINILSGCCGWNAQESDAKLNLIPSDVTDFVLPDRYFLKESFQDGEVPVWNPLYFGGETYLANLQSTVFHPVNIFLLFFSPLTVQNISTIASLVLMAAFMYPLLRKLHASFGASVFASVLYALSPFAIFWSTFGMMTWIMAVFPLIVYLVLRWRETHKLYNLAIMSVALGVTTLMGHIQFSFVAFLLPLLLGLGYVVFDKAGLRARIKNFILLGLFILVGGMIGSLQLLPFLEQAQIGHRVGVVLVGAPDGAEKIFYDIGNFFSMYQFKFGNDQAYYQHFGPFFLSIGLLGALLLLLGIIRGVLQRGRYNLFFFGVFVFGLLWMWGSLPQQVLESVISIFKSLKPAYFISIPLFTAVILAAYGFDYFVDLVARAQRFVAARTTKQYKDLAKKVFVWMSVLCTIGLIIYGYLILRGPTRGDIGFKDLLLFHAMLLVVWVTIIICMKPGRLKLAASLVPALFVLVQALGLYFATQPIVPKSVFAAGNPYYQSIVEDLKGGNPNNVRMIYPFSPQTNLYYGIGALNGYDALYAKSIEDGIDYINHPQKTLKLSETSHNAIYVSNSAKTNSLQNLGVGYVIQGEDEIPPPDYTVLYRKSPFIVYKSIKETPQVYFADTITTASASEQIDRLKQDTTQYHEVVIEESSGAQNKETGSTVSYEIKTNSIQIETNSSQDQLLFVGQTYRKQWAATNEKNENLKILKANYNYMAIEVPKGRHSITLAYVSESFKAGVIISGVSLFAVIIVGIISISKRGRETHGKKRL